MKFKTKNTKSYLILFLVISSFLITVHSETSKAKRLNKYLNQRLSKNKSSSNSKIKRNSAESGDDIEKAINMFDFVLGILTCLPVIDDYATIIEDFIDDRKNCTKSKIIKHYKKGVEHRKDARFAEKVQTLDQMDQLKSSWVWRPSEKTEVTIKDLEATNPKKACQAIVVEKERQIKENKKYIKIYEGALQAANDIKKNQFSFDDFLKKLPSAHLEIFNSEIQNNYLNLKHYFKRTIFYHLKVKSIEEIKILVHKKQVDWETLINDTIEILSDNQKMAKLNLQEMGFSGDDLKPDCSKLPTDNIFKDNKTTILDRFAGGWAALKYVGKCVIKSLPNNGYENLKRYLIDLLSEMGIHFLKKLIIVFGSVITNILSFFVLKGVKILWWLIKTIYFIYKAIESKVNEKYRYWGKAVGSGIRIIYIAFMPTERRRFKLRRH